MQRCVIFLDALDHRELQGFLSDTYQGKIELPPTRVTPTVLGSIYTGNTPGEHGLIRPTPLYRNSYQKPDGELIMEKLSRDARVLSWNMPFTMGMQLEKGLSAQEGLAGGGNAPPALFLPQPPINMGDAMNDDEQAEKYFQSFVDHARGLFSTARQLIRANSADIFFLSFRNLDSLTHWCYDGDQRQRLIQYLAMELSEFALMGDDVETMYFSDHGGTPATDVFRINRWLEEKGYLKLSIHHKRYEEQLKVMEENGQKPWKDQIDLQSPLVQIDEYTAYSSDAFDSCIDVNPDATQSEIEHLIADLESEGVYDAVYRKEDLYPGSKTNPKIPEIIPDRKPGILVSGNVYPIVPVWGFTDHKTVVNSRDGDHSRYGCFGGTVDLGAEEVVAPWDFHNVITEFCKDVTDEGAKAEESLQQQQEEALTPEEDEKVKERLRAMGYM